MTKRQDDVGAPNSFDSSELGKTRPESADIWSLQAIWSLRTILFGDNNNIEQNNFEENTIGLIFINGLSIF